MRVLVVDDDPTVCESLRKMLAHDGHNVDASHSALDAVQKLADVHYDLALIDYSLGTTMTGVEVGKHALLEGTPVIIVTGYSVQHMRGNWIDPLRGFMAVVAKSATIGKPVDWDVLRKHIQRIEDSMEDTDPAGKTPTDLK
jgi:CheY-like chemotaxis protein